MNPCSLWIYYFPTLMVHYEGKYERWRPKGLRSQWSCLALELRPFLPLLVRGLLLSWRSAKKMGGWKSISHGLRNPTRNRSEEYLPKLCSKPKPSELPLVKARVQKSIKKELAASWKTWPHAELNQMISQLLSGYSESHSPHGTFL